MAAAAAEFAVAVTPGIAQPTEAPAAPPPSQRAPQESLLLAPGATAEIQCDTQAVLVATDAANATSGQIRLRIERTAEPGQDGRWKPLSEAGTHAASLATLQAKTCATGCPFTIGKNNDLQLWAPAAKGVDKLGPDELLTLVIIKSATLQLKASTFRGQSIEALESGSCRRDDAAQTRPSQAPTAPTPTAPPKAEPPTAPAAPDTGKSADGMK